MVKFIKVSKHYRKSSQCLMKLWLVAFYATVQIEEHI